LGIEASDIRTGQPATAAFVGNEAYEEVAEAASAQVAPAPTGFDLRMIEITLRDPRRAEQLRAALEEAGIAVVPRPTFSLSDETLARRAAYSQALQRARSDADAVAAAMGMRVARVLRVSQRIGEGAVGWTVYAAIRQAYGLTDSGEPIAETQVRIDVDFALAPQ
jgi:uncharacterized protein YggE